MFHPEAEGKPYLIPLFWQKADCREAIEEEMRRMKEVGIHSFVLEPRPHPDYLGEGWWNDLDFVLQKAEELDMYIYFFDDGLYPSGTANGLLAQRYPEALKRHWKEHHMDASGPLPHAHFLIDDWLREDESVVRIIAARRIQRGTMLDSSSLLDVTSYYRHGRLYWSVPEGEWRIFLIKNTRDCGEKHTQDYCNPLCHDAVRRYIDLVHEEHYARYASQFGKRIRGFFTDEPRFGNITGYDRIIGLSKMLLPCSDTLLEELSHSPLGDFSRYLPLLWYADEQEVCRDVRYHYMDTVSSLFAENFTGQLGDWCRDHGVELIGHLVEENGAHARLGYGAGHYFRAMKGLDMAGLDVVCNLFPEQTSGEYSTLFNEFDCDFNHWGLAKMVSSAAHADPKKKNRALCEAFGAYGWSEGLKTVKWITDQLAVRGIGYITPHAFSPSPFPDADCPPHFYARGQNPQFRYYKIWSDYANRLCDTLSEARHKAPAAVLYHAEGEWGSYLPDSPKAEPFEKVVRVLAENQIDCDVVCMEDVLTASVEEKQLRIHQETFRVLIIPYTPNIDERLEKKLHEFHAAGLPVYFTHKLPSHRYFDLADPAPSLADFPVIPTKDAAEVLQAANLCDVLCTPSDRDLQLTHYAKDGMDWYFLVNQSTRKTLTTKLQIQDDRKALFYDAMEDRYFRPSQVISENSSEVELCLEPWQSLFLVFGSDESTELVHSLPEKISDCDGEKVLSSWSLSMADASQYPAFTPVSFSDTSFSSNSDPFSSSAPEMVENPDHSQVPASTLSSFLEDLSLPEYLPDFTGTIRYETEISLPEDRELSLPLWIEIPEAGEIVEVFLDGRSIGTRLTPPYRFAFTPDSLSSQSDLSALPLTIEVTNTVVKAQHHNPFDPYFVQDPTGIVGEVVLRYHKKND